MRIIKKSFKKDGEGYVVLIPTDDEDLWHIYNLIQPQDHIKMRTLRKIVNVNQTGLKSVRRKKLTLTLSIVSIDYFSNLDKLAIRVKGRNVEQNEYLKIGQYHNFEIQLESKITIIKEVWGSFQRNLLKEISTLNHNVEIAAMVMDEGIAHLCYVKSTITLLVQKIQKNVSKKSCGEQIHSKSLGKFFLDCYRSIRGIDINPIKCFIIASPGFVNEQFMKFIQQQCQNEDDKKFKKDLEKFLLVKCSTGYLQSLQQVLVDPKVIPKLENTKAITQTKVLQKFYDIMKKNENLVAYGQKQVIKCISIKAVDTLLISDSLFRTKDLKKRKVYNELVDQVKKYGGQTVIFSSLHPSGEKLKNITGIAAILKFQVVTQEQQEQPDEIEVKEPEEIDESEIVKAQFRKFSIVSDDDDDDKSEEEVIQKQ